MGAVVIRTDKRQQFEAKEILFSVVCEQGSPWGRLRLRLLRAAVPIFSCAPLGATSRPAQWRQRAVWERIRINPHLAGIRGEPRRRAVPVELHFE